jgi:vacuolar-type H+-ATPase subunit F/Vma7
VREILKSLLNEEVGIILIPDNFVPHIRDFLAQLRSTALPCILPIPTGKEKMKFGSKEIRELVKKAVGVDIIKE